jgi:predicted DNA-binding transcriptional regulator YafY
MHRDIAALRAAGVPLWTKPGRHGGVRLVEGWRSRLDGLTSREAVAIFAVGVPRALTELGLGTAVSAAHAKVTAPPCPHRCASRRRRWRNDFTLTRRAGSVARTPAKPSVRSRPSQARCGPSTACA